MVSPTNLSKIILGNSLKKKALKLLFTLCRPNTVLKTKINWFGCHLRTSLIGVAAIGNTRHRWEGHFYIAAMFQRYLRPMYDRTLTGGELWNQAEYMQQVGGAWGRSRQSLVSDYFQVPLPRGPATVETRQALALNTLSCAWMHARTNFTLTWNSVVLRMWRPSGLHRELTSPIEPSSILQCQSGCSIDHTWGGADSHSRTAFSRHRWHPSQPPGTSVTFIVDFRQ